MSTSLKRLSQGLSTKIGLPVKCALGEADARVMVVSPEVFERNHGFFFRVMRPYEHQLSIEVVIGKYGGGVLRNLSSPKPLSYDALVGGVSGMRLCLEVGPHRIIDEKDLRALPFDEWRANKDAIRIIARRTSQGLPSDGYEEAVILASLAFMLLHCELPETSEFSSEEELIEEGGRRLVLTTRYERSRLNRARCLAYHGSCCAVCGFDFLARFGSSFVNCIEVHHITPLSELDGPAGVDPRADLVPLCPNCHAAVHTQQPPIHPDSLREMLAHGE